MQRLDITLETLLNNYNIDKILIGKIWHFSQIDINRVYNDNFKDVNAIQIKCTIDKKIIGKYISFFVIEEHVEFIRTKMLVENEIDKENNSKSKKIKFVPKIFMRRM